MLIITPYKDCKVQPVVTTVVPEDQAVVITVVPDAHMVDGGKEGVAHISFTLNANPLNNNPYGAIIVWIPC